MEWNEVRRAINDGVALVFFIEKVEFRQTQYFLRTLSTETSPFRGIHTWKTILLKFVSWHGMAWHDMFVISKK